MEPADRLVYCAKGERANHVCTARVRIEDGVLVDVVRDVARTMPAV